MYSTAREKSCPLRTALLCMIFLLFLFYVCTERKCADSSKLEALLCKRNTDNGNAKNSAYNCHLLAWQYTASGMHLGENDTQSFSNTLGFATLVSPAGSVTSGSESPLDSHSIPSVSLRYSQQRKAS